MWTVEGATPDSDEQFAEWYVWAKREVSSYPRVCFGVAQAAIEALTSGADRPAAEMAARRSVAGPAVGLAAKVSPWRQGYARWYDWARLEFGGEPERLHRLTRIAIQRLKSDGDAGAAAEVARSAAAADPPAPRGGGSTEAGSGTPWTQGRSMSPGGWGGVPFSASTSPVGPDPSLPFGSAPGGSALYGARPAAGRPAAPVSFEPVAFAGLGQRLGAAVIDGVLCLFGAALVFFLVAIFFVIAVISTREFSAAEELLTEVALLVIVSVLYWLYDAGLESSAARGTVGKRALKLVVLDKYGRQVSFGRATGRHFVKFVPLALTALPLYLSIPALAAGFVDVLSLGLALIGLIFLVLLALEIFMVAWTRRKQGLQDLIAGTLVVRRDMLSRVVPATMSPPPPPTLPEPLPGVAGAPRGGETVPRGS